MPTGVYDLSAPCGQDRRAQTGIARLDRPVGRNAGGAFGYLSLVKETGTEASAIAGATIQNLYPARR